jgi:thioesterase domain-containing protein
MVAFEMARQLEMQKQRVGLVVLLDTLLDPHEGSPSVHNRVQNHLARISEMRSLETLTYVLGRLNTNLRTEVYDRARRRMRRVAAEALRPTCAALGRPVSDDVIQQCFMAASDRMGEHYVPQRVSTRLLLFRGTDGGSDSTWGWGGLTSEGVEVHCVRADHLRMLSEPAVQQVAEILSRTLREARPRVAR